MAARQRVVYRNPEVAPNLQEMFCNAEGCRDRSDVRASQEDAARWASAHSERTGHASFRLETTNYYRVAVEGEAPLPVF